MRKNALILSLAAALSADPALAQPIRRLPLEARPEELSRPGVTRKTSRDVELEAGVPKIIFQSDTTRERAAFKLLAPAYAPDAYGNLRRAVVQCDRDDNEMRAYTGDRLLFVTTVRPGIVLESAKHAYSCLSEVDAVLQVVQEFHQR